MGRIDDIKTEIDTDPLVRAYSGMTDQQVADSMNTVDRPAEGSIEELRKYLLLEKKAAMSLLGRLEVLAAGTVGSDPLGDTISGGLTLEHITAAKALLRIADPASGFTLDYNDSRFNAILDDLAGGVGNALAINPADKTAIQALSNNQQSRGNEIGVGHVKVGHVTHARALP